MLTPFDLDGPVLAEARSFVVTPAAAGGFDVCAAALARLLATAMDEGLWWVTIDLPEPHPNHGFAHLGPDEDGALYTEVAGDFYLPVGSKLDERQWAALRRLGWADPVLTLSDDEEIQPRNHTRSWPIDELPEACAHVLLTLVEVYGFRVEDPLRVSLEPFL